MKPANLASRPPAGYRTIPVRTYYLEMKRNMAPKPPAPPPDCAVERWEKPGIAEYRELFAAVGGQWGWSGRLIMKEEEIKAILHARTTEVYRLRCHGATAGFAELDRGVPGQTEITYFGLIPGFIGRGLGKFLLNWAIHRAWEGTAERVWLHTCQYDHPGALSVYLKAGFNLYGEQVEMQPYPEEFIRKSTPPGV
jgi:GNAT superfamily N-acetyltransferase